MIDPKVLKLQKTTTTTKKIGELTLNSKNKFETVKSESDFATRALILRSSGQRIIQKDLGLKTLKRVKITDLLKKMKEEVTFGLKFFYKY